MDGPTIGWRIGIHDLDHGPRRLRVEGFIGHEQRRSRRQYPIKPGGEVTRQFDSGDRHRIDLGTLLSQVPRHADSQPPEFAWIGNVGIGYAARAVGEHQCVIDERRIAGDHQSGSTDLDPVTIDDNALAALTEHDADRSARRQLRLPTLLFSGCKWHALDGLAADKLDRSEIPRMRDPLWRSCLGADHDSHAIGRDLEESPCKLAWQVNAAVRFGIAG